MHQSKKLALVTGASRGIGKAIAMELAKQQISIILHFNSSEHQAKDTTDELEQLGAKVYQVQADFSSNYEIESFFQTKIDPILEHSGTGGLDYMVNNAGISGFKSLHSISGSDIDNYFSINFKAPLLLMKEGYSRMNTGGRIVNISSTTVARPYEKMVVYGATKAALDNVSKAVIKGFGKKGITVNTIAPGFIATDIVNVNTESSMVKSFILKKYAIKRLGSTQDVAKLVLFLLSEDAGWINGQTIEISGGFLYE